MTKFQDTSIQSLKNSLKHNQAWPNKELSQNFLIDKSVLEEIILAANLESQDLVVEVGAGTGILTQALAKCCQQLLAVEYDQKLLPVLSKSIKEFVNVKIINRDIMQLPIPELLKNFSSEKNKSYKIIANLPYHLTSHFLRFFLEAEQPPESLTLMLQKEVGQRICAKPGQLSVLGISVQVFGIPNFIATVPKNCFWPQPKVDSAIIHIKRRIKPLLAKELLPSYFSLIKAAFLSKRKTLVNSLSVNLCEKPNKIKKIFEKLGFSPMVRAQELSLENWMKLYKALKV